MFPPVESAFVSHLPRQVILAVWLIPACILPRTSCAQDIGSLSDDEIKQRIGAIWDRQVRRMQPSAQPRS